MRTRLLARSAPLLLAAALLAGCGEDAPSSKDIRTGDSPTSPSTPGSTGTPESARAIAAGPDEGPVPGSGAALDSSKTDQWCQVITTEQASALTGAEATEIVTSTTDTECAATIAGEALSVGWRTMAPEGTLQGLFERSSARDNIEVELVTLAGGQPALVEIVPTAPLVTVTVIEDGRQIESGVMVIDPDSGVSTQEATVMSAAIVSAYLH